MEKRKISLRGEVTRVTLLVNGTENVNRKQDKKPKSADGQEYEWNNVSRQKYSNGHVLSKCIASAVFCVKKKTVFAKWLKKICRNCAL